MFSLRVKIYLLIDILINRSIKYKLLLNFILNIIDLIKSKQPLCLVLK